MKLFLNCKAEFRPDSGLLDQLPENVIIIPQPIDVTALSNKCTVFAPSADPVPSGPFTGKISPDQLAKRNVKGIMLNHAEKQMNEEDIRKVIALAKAAQLEILLCVDAIDRARSLVRYLPNYLALEIPELIGSGISLVTAEEKAVKTWIDEMKKRTTAELLCGAGISSREDVVAAEQMGFSGVLVSSAITRAKDPLKKMCELLKK